MFLFFIWTFTRCSSCPEISSANVKGKSWWMDTLVCACEYLFQQNFTTPPLITFQNSCSRSLKKVTCSNLCWENKYIQYSIQAENNDKKANSLQSSCAVHTAWLHCSKSLGKESLSSVTKCLLRVNWFKYFCLPSFLHAYVFILPVLWKILCVLPKSYLSLLRKDLFPKHQVDGLHSHV